MDIKYLGYADKRTFAKDDFGRHDVKGGKDIEFTQGEGSVQTVSADVGAFLIENHGDEFAEATDENKDVTNASDTTNAAGTPAFSASPATPAPTGDTTTEGDIS